VDLPMGHLWTLRDGKVARMEAFADRDRAREAAGLTSPPHTEVVRVLIEDSAAVADGRAPDPELLAHVSEDLEFRPVAELPGPRLCHGADGYIEFLKTWVEDFESWTLEVERIVDAGDGRVVAVTHQAGIGKGSGAAVDLRFAGLYEFEEGLLKRVQLFLDPRDAFHAAGIEG